MISSSCCIILGLGTVACPVKKLAEFRIVLQKLESLLEQVLSGSCKAACIH